MHLYDRRCFLVGYESFAQAGEDLVLWNWCKALGIDRPTYLDIGANDPILHTTPTCFTRMVAAACW